MSNQICPCGSEQSYSNCCKLAHQNHGSVQTAEALMRSRYSAFALGLGTYLQASHSKKTRPSHSQGNETEAWAKSVSWMKLEVKNSTKGAVTDADGTVEFCAYFLEHGKLNTITEHSYFENKNGLWYYVGLVQ